MAKEIDYPEALTSQLKPDDEIIKFLPLGGKGRKARGFIAITEQRIIFKAISRDKGKKKSTEEALNVPLSKVASILVKHEVEKKGLLSKEHTYTLEVNVQGAVYGLVLENEPAALDAANEFVRTFLECSE